MGTRADFYLRKNEQMIYCGSIAWDGYEIDEVANATDEQSYLSLLKVFLLSRTDGSFPDKHGWPWPWKNSKLTDEIWVWDCETNAIWRGWKRVGEYEDHTTPYLFYKGVEQQGIDDNYNEVDVDGAVSWLLPDMSDIQNVTMGTRSGLLVFSL